MDKWTYNIFWERGNSLTFPQFGWDRDTGHGGDGPWSPGDHWDESGPAAALTHREKQALCSPAFSQASSGSGGKLKKKISTLPWQWVQEGKGANHHKIFLFLINAAKVYTFTFKYSLWLLSAPFVSLWAWAAWLVLVSSLRDNITVVMSSLAPVTIIIYNITLCHMSQDQQR